MDGIDGPRIDTPSRGTGVRVESVRSRSRMGSGMSRWRSARALISERRRRKVQRLPLRARRTMFGHRYRWCVCGSSRCTK